METDETPQTTELQSLRVKIMVSTLLDPSAMSHLYEIKKLTNSISDQIPLVKFAKWKDLQATKEGRPKINKMPLSPQDSEEYIDGFHGNINQSKGYYRLHLLHPKNIATENFKAVFSQLNIPQKRSIQIAPTNILYPSTVGFIKGSTEAMMHSPDLHAILKQSNVEFGLEWKYIQTGKNGKFDRNQKAVYVETNAIDAPQIKAYLAVFFADNNPIFGANLGFQPILQYGTNTQLNQVRLYAPTQSKLVASLLDIDLEIANFEEINVISDTNKETTSILLVEALLNLTSITQKKSIKKGNEFLFNGNIFYSAITNAESKITTFQFFDYNETEAKGILSGLPLFLRDHFNIPEEKLHKYCRSSHIVDAKNGTWDLSTRTFLTKAETMELELFENLQAFTNATTVTIPTYIDPNHHRMMMGHTEEETSMNTNLHAQDEGSSLTTNTGSTRTSKAQKYADGVRKEMIKEMQYQRENNAKEIERLHQLLKNANISPTMYEKSVDETGSILQFTADDATVHTDNSRKSERRHKKTHHTQEENDEDDHDRADKNNNYQYDEEDDDNEEFDDNDSDTEEKDNNTEEENDNNAEETNKENLEDDSDDTDDKEEEVIITKTTRPPPNQNISISEDDSSDEEEEDEVEEEQQTRRTYVQNPPKVNTTKDPGSYQLRSPNKRKQPISPSAITPQKKSVVQDSTLDEDYL